MSWSFTSVDKTISEYRGLLLIDRSLEVSGDLGSWEDCVMEYRGVLWSQKE